MEEELFKHLLTPVHAQMEHFFYVNYNCNLYRGCNHGCIYCDTRSICYRLKRFDTVRVKANVIDMLRNELKSKKKTGVIGIGAASDSYNPHEEKMLITKQALEVIQKERFGISLSTKSSLIARDAELLHAISKNAPVGIAFSITTASDGLCKIFEPNASASSARFDAMATLSKHHIFCGTWMNPMLPFLTDSKENIRQIVRMTKEAGGRFVLSFMSMTLRTGNREYFFNALDQHFPGLKAEYTKTYQNAYELTSIYADTLYPFLISECEQNGLLYRFKDINHEMLTPATEQLTFF